MRIGLWLIVVYGSVCALALAAIALGAAGWIAPDPLSAIPAILLGLPWSDLLLTLADSQSLSAKFALLGAAMAMNAALVWLLVRAVRRWRRA
jgi:hypothetical protein